MTGEDEDTELRLKAERALRDASPASMPEPEADMTRLMHELRVHQIELELQNEELRETRARAEEGLALYRDLYDSAPAAYLSVHRDGTIIRANPSASALLMREPDRLIGRSLGELVAPEARQEMVAFLARAFASGSQERLESSLLRPGAGPVYARLLGVGACARKDECLLALIDMTDREALERASKEKSALMRELQHRVKNNLNVVSSLLGIGQGQLEDPKAIAVLEKARARIMAMSNIYEQLYSSEEVLEVDLWLYLEHLIGPLLETYSVDSSRFRLVKKFQSVKIDAQRAALAGLMFSELISNSTKYAYPEGRSGELRVSLLEKAGVIELGVSDDGVGLPEGFDWRTSDSMGFTILRMLALQMRAELGIESSPEGGVSTTLRIMPDSRDDHGLQSRR